jgi:NAD+ kinase
MRIGLAVNTESERGIETARKVMEFLNGRNADVVLEEKSASAMDLEGQPLEKMENDVLITIGGDGTILRSLRRTRSRILGINVGVLGFLTELKTEDFESGLEKLLNGEFNVEIRSKLKVLVDGKRYADCTNEAVIHTAQVAKMRRFGIYIDDQKASDVRADGIIISTSTGSTCYAMSVGGPILDPKVDAMVVAPIAPFKLAARSMVVPMECGIAIRVLESDECVLVLDGQEEVELKGTETLELAKSEHKAEFIRFGDNFYKRIHEKLGG